MIKKLFSHTAIYGLAPQITKIGSFLALPIITKDLTDIDYGVSGVLTAYTSAISVLATLGLKVVLVNAFFKSPGQYKWAWRQIYGFLNYWNIIYAFILGLLIYMVIPDVAEKDKWTILFLNMGPLIFFGPTKSIGTAYYQLKQKPVQIASRSAIFGFLGIGLNILFISHYKMGYMGWFWSSFIVGMIYNVSFFYPLNFVLGFKPIYNFKRRLIRNSLKVSLPLVPHYYSSYLLNSSDKMVMDVMKIGTGDIGKYNVAYTVGNVMNSLGTASGLAVGPLINGFYKKKQEKKARNLIFILQTSFFLLTFGVCLWMKEAFDFLIRNEELAKMYYLGIVIVMAYNYRPMYLAFSSKTMFYEFTNVMWKLTLTAGIINVILNLLLLPLFGFEVAAFTTFVAYMFMGYAGYYFKVFKDNTEVKYYPLLWLFTTIVLTVIAYFAVELNFYIKLLISLFTLLTGSLLVWHFNKLLKNEEVYEKGSI
ncbi:oligosaccharide flippase family protein [Salinimicrobium sp. MT39]|uniref:Oligosaccharide flippase family protein n=1 Tax=Salinimicrobium profundisediminis TaxID=2994553 RepID=A0A9X3CW57_9FLAO|nr:oligosaccharide flippase family protein [Salinimicrobium profundisediminis]MCX2837911.1 oligosaccharide flippase family protein [Salinimicrobium profundisediminis]